MLQKKIYNQRLISPGPNTTTHDRQNHWQITLSLITTCTIVPTIKERDPAYHSLTLFLLFECTTYELHICIQ